MLYGRTERSPALPATPRARSRASRRVASPAVALALGIGCCAAMLSPTCVRAGVLPPGAIFSPLPPDTALTGTTLAATPSLSGTLVAQKTVAYADDIGTLGGSLQMQVVRESGAGTLDFYYRVLPNGKAVDDVTVGNFHGLKVSADYLADSEGIGAFPYAARSANGATIDFGSAGLDSYDQPTRFFVIQTSATTFDAKGFASINGPVRSTQVAAFEPSGAAPPSGPTPVPLAPAVFPGITGLLTAAGLVVILRRSRVGRRWLA